MVEKVHYIKSQSLVELPVHGGYGGINTSNGQLALSVFSERAPLPRVIEFDGEGTEEARESKDGIVRNVTATLYFDINTAIALRNWLDEKIGQFKDAHPELFEGEDGEVKSDGS
ncbi:hypothetical protein JQU17_17785 [Ponticoccus sp. SC2-23]|uniref:hypothetical protein n=1 Tax=Alexandriicola marinus TaxID=2081710 RepID=UPI000FDA462A|nr:hypothetical protein [Alexandriicola marinus]MBM1222052.1 hypothetical protein [Ponticoccus sp. SC6-9]MBM1226739.1 hypothetical protein [Ponticoccus sp. SC6-15]MBM1230999.1 hypothetical protein [Ponticoccus sp. SC6-38]MBM1235749.1 hypothetical protein [Ponticoccus sp. SC6-45]MBM1240021.1 hypothetical protein [Ponticoccus sp. SC6-49]MBM1244375.1 hypothetical protein [Ponticoccus sp. SC2-64]MBM1249223.1 hypothetical protein [Ponticoccus sp. SC6-42]MBM1253676.1 hypothetical protein [Pontico